MNPKQIALHRAETFRKMDEKRKKEERYQQSRRQFLFDVAKEAELYNGMVRTERNVIIICVIVIIGVFVTSWLN